MKIKMFTTSIHFLLSFAFLTSCSSAKKVNGIELNKLRVGQTSALSITEMYGAPHSNAQVPNDQEFYSPNCGLKSDYLEVMEYKLGSAVKSESDRVTLFFNKRKILCRVERKDFDL